MANVASGGVTEIDGANPILLSARTTSVNTIDLTFSEDLLGTTVTNADFSVEGYTLDSDTDAYEVSAGIVRLTLTSAFGTGDTPAITYSGVVKDLKDNVAPTAGPITPSDGVAPTFTAQTTSASTILVAFSEPMSAVIK